MNEYTKIGLSVAAGSILGYAYYYFIGCQTGHCPITSNWYISTLYGAAIGLTLGFPKKVVPKQEVPKKEEDNDQKVKHKRAELSNCSMELKGQAFF